MKTLFALLILTTQTALASGLVAFRSGHSEPLMAMPMAGTPPAVIEPDPASYFGKTHAWFETGLATKWIDIKGYHVGRCFTFDNPNAAANSFLGYVDSNAGPGFADLPMAIENIWQPGAKADAFDNMASYDSLINDTKKIINESLNKYSPVSENPTVNQLYDMEPNNRPDQLSEWKFHEDKIVLRVTNLITQSLEIGNMTSRKLVPAGQVLLMCYYFKKVAD